MQREQEKSVLRRDGEILAVSALILFLELVLIRWIGVEIRIFAYLGNLILVACFFGVGLGCYLSARPASLLKTGFILLILVVLVANPLRMDLLDLRQITDWLAGFEDSPLWGMFVAPGDEVVWGFIAVGLLLYLVVQTFVPLGQVLGRAMQEHPQTLRAYSINVVGSLAGTWMFVALSCASVAPSIWFAVAAGLMVLLIAAMRLRNWWAMGAVALAACCVWFGGRGSARIIWSPYQKLTLTPLVMMLKPNPVQVGYVVEANGTGYQVLANLSDEFTKAHPAIYSPKQIRLSHYNVAFAYKSPVHRLLIVGAGGGNNAAAALRHGVEQIDCVEIDPEIVALGKELHPERPYDSPRVRMYVDDARAFLKRTNQKYDMIWFGLLDTHPGSSYNNRRLDHYVYTMESFREAHRLLTDDGVLVMNFAARRQWIADRLERMIREVFGRPLLAYFDEENASAQYGANGELTIVAANHSVHVDTLSDEFQRFVTAHPTALTGTVRPTTDDWPYLYLEKARIPRLHLFTMLTILAIVALARWRVSNIGTGFDWHFFALGAAFLLLEVQTVSRATLLFGMTWIVNAIVISAVLVMILLANLAQARYARLPQWFIVTGLAATVLALAVIPLDWFNTLAAPTKLVAASTFLTAPVFFAGLIFIRSFAACADKSRALGSNLIGALAGGLLESVSFVTGIRALVLLVGAFYVVALLLRPGRAQNAQAAGQ